MNFVPSAYASQADLERTRMAEAIVESQKRLAAHIERVNVEKAHKMAALMQARYGTPEVPALPRIPSAEEINRQVQMDLQTVTQ